MHKVKINGLRKVRKIPKGWDQMRSRPLKFAIRALITHQDPNLAKLRILKYMLRISTDELARIPDDQLVELLQLISWMDISKLTKPIFPEIRWKGKKWILPGEGFDHGTGFQYAAADDFFMSLQSSQDPGDLDKMIASLLYYDHPLNEIREVEDLAPIFSKLPDIYRMSILAYFNGIKQFIYNTYAAWLFTSEGSEDELSIGVDFHWWGRFLEIAKSGVFGSIKQVYGTRFHDLCVFLVQEKEIYIAEKKKIEQSKK